MSKLKINREKLNLTQEELSVESGISVRTIQRIEAGKEPKGQTLKRLAKTLGVNEVNLLDNERHEKEEVQIDVDTTLHKLINISSLPFTIFPPVNIVLPLIIMFAKKQYSPLAKQIVSIQILWFIFAFIVFMLSAFSKKWFLHESNYMLVVMILLILINVVIILRNSKEIDQNGKLYFKPKFSLI